MARPIDGRFPKPEEAEADLDRELLERVQGERVKKGWCRRLCWLRMDLEGGGTELKYGCENDLPGDMARVWRRHACLSMSFPLGFAFASTPGGILDPRTVFRFDEPCSLEADAACPDNKGTS